MHTRPDSNGAALVAAVDVLASAARSVDDPAVAPILAWGLEGDVVFVVEHWPEGPTLAEVLATNPQSAPLAGVVVKELIGALHAAHGGGVVHGRPTPTDVVFSERGRGPAVLGGFVLSHACELATDDRPCLEIGVDPYSAPERRAGARPSPATDLYAVGAMAYEAAIGHPPVASNGAGPTMPAGPNEVAAPVAGLLAADPQTRRHAANAVHQQSRADRRREGVALPPIDPEPWLVLAAGPLAEPAPPGGWRRWLGALLAPSVVLVAAAVALVIRG
jgi:serine/threonine-protein kinase